MAIAAAHDRLAEDVLDMLIVNADIASREMIPAVVHGAVYLVTFCGTGALLSQCIKSVELVAFENAGPGAMFRFEVENFPAVVINDVAGRDFYEEIRDEKKLSH